MYKYPLFLSLVPLVFGCSHSVKNEPVDVALYYQLLLSEDYNNLNSSIEGLSNDISKSILKLSIFINQNKLDEVRGLYHGVYNQLPFEAHLDVLRYLIMQVNKKDPTLCLVIKNLSNISPFNLEVKHAKESFCS